jgi:hypothetical protein
VNTWPHQSIKQARGIRMGVFRRMPVIILVATTDIRAHDEIVVRNPQSHVAGVHNRLDGHESSPRCSRESLFLDAIHLS